jgi:Baseplate J-like protein
MPLTIPTLDDRRYAELLDEALARIPIHNPEWTNFNRSDPGVTLIEVFAFLTESLLYRCNQIPERNRRKFLSLVGVPLNAGASARGIVTFTNDRGPLQSILLTGGLELRAGQVPFQTEHGLDLLPVDAKAYYKRAIPNPPELLREHYRQLYASFRGQPASADVRLYETVPFPPEASAAPSEPAAALDGAIWIALLLRAGDVPADEALRNQTREAIAGKTLSLGVIPSVTDASRRLRPGGAADAEAAPTLVYELPRIPAGGGLPVAASQRIPQYRSLEASTGADVFAEPGVVQITLPTAGELTLWNNLDPLEPGSGDFPPTLEDTHLADRVITWLRLRSTPSLPSQLKWVGINAVTVAQRAHVAAEVLADGTGEPDQTRTLSHRPVLAGSVRLTVSSRGVIDRDWREIDDLLAAGPEVPVQDPKDPPGTPPPPPKPSKVFALNAEAGELRFGDGLRGGRPPKGALLRADYDYGVGRAGNVGPGAISSGPALPGGVKVANPERTWGGADPEPVSEGEKQIARHLQHRNRLVTTEDFEAVTLRTPGVEIGRVEVLPAYNPELPQNEPGDAPGAVTLMVIPRRDPMQPDAPRPDRFFLNSICRYLDARRLVTTELIVRGPTYTPIWISVGIAVVAGMSLAEVREAVRQTLIAYVSPLPPGGVQTLEDRTELLRTPQLAERRRGWPLGKPVADLELQAVASRVGGVLLVNRVLLAQGTSPAEPQVSMRGLELPRVAGISVVVGDPVGLDTLRGQVPTSAAATAGLVPIPVVPEEC